jgi:hypothetical protein
MRPDYRFAHAREPCTESLGGDTLRHDAPAFQQQMEFVGEHFRLA